MSGTVSLRPGNLCPYCNLPLPRGWVLPRCPRCGADTAVRPPPVSWLSSLVAAFSGFLFGLAATGNLLRLLPAPGLSGRQAMLIVFATSLLLGALLGWLSRHLVPSVLPAFFRATLALLTGGLLGVFLGAPLMAAARSPETSTWLADPGLLLALQAGVSLVTFLAVRAAGL